MGAERDPGPATPAPATQPPGPSVAPPGIGPAALLALQRTAGNAAVVALLRASSGAVSGSGDEVIRRKSSTFVDESAYETDSFAGGERPSRVLGRLRPRSTKGRGPTATPVTGPLPLGYDGGHVFGLELGGADLSVNVVPMFPRFNRGTWRAIETEILKDAREHASQKPAVEISVGYADATQTVPTDFAAEISYDDPAAAAATSGSPPRHTKKYPTKSQPSDIATTAPADPATQGLLTNTKAVSADAASATTGGDVYERAAGAYLTETGDAAGANDIKTGHHLPVSKRASYPDDPKNRPYEHLDILALAGDVDTKTTLADRMVFSARQRQLIVQTNMARNGGLLKSDDPADPVYKAPHSYDRLDERGTVNAPEIDHIVPKVSGGSNFFSNARVVSWLLNNKEDRIKNITGLVDTGRLQPPIFPTTGTNVEKMRELLPDVASRMDADFTAADVCSFIGTTYNKYPLSASLREAIDQVLGEMVLAKDLTFSGGVYSAP